MRVIPCASVGKEWVNLEVGLAATLDGQNENVLKHLLIDERLGAQSFQHLDLYMIGGLFIVVFVRLGVQLQYALV